MKTKVLIDTCVWLGMVEDPRRAPLLKVIEELIRTQALDLIVPETVLEEFEFRRRDVATRATSTWASHLKTVREALPLINVNPKTLPVALAHLEEVSRQIHVVGSSAEILLDRIQDLLRANKAVNTQAVMQAAVRRSRESRAPCHNKKKNSIADALIIEAYAKAIIAKRSDTRFAFVSYNVTDFSMHNGDERKPHADLASLFADDDSSYFIDLLAALRSVDESIVTRTMLKVDPTVRDAINLYVSDTRPDAQRMILLRRMSQSALADVNAATLSASDIVNYCRLRRQTVPTLKGTTLKQDLIYLKSALRHAAKTNHNISFAAFSAAKPMLEKEFPQGESEPRATRPKAEDITQVIEHFESRATLTGIRKLKYPIADVLNFTLASGRKIGELCNLEWRHVNKHNRTGELHDQGRARFSTAPIKFKFTPEAWEIICRQPTAGSTGRIFPFAHKSVGRCVSIAIKSNLKIPDLILDDFRREAEIRVYLKTRSVEKVLEMTGGTDANAVLERIEAALLPAQDPSVEAG